MNRVGKRPDGFDSASGMEHASAVPLESIDELFEQSLTYDAVPGELYALNELDILYDKDTETLWSYMSPTGRPSFTPSMLRDFENWQDSIGQGFGPGKVPLKFLVLASRSPGVFCLGGDLDLFQKLIRDRNRDGLVQYGHRCCQILYRNMRTLDLPIVTIGLVEGAALGGGFEALLSFDFIIAERSATFGLPEILFGLFPGMGAHAFLSRKLGSAMANRLITSKETYTAKQMFDLGIVHQLVDDGEGLNATREFIKRSARRHSGLLNSRRAMKVSWNLQLQELFTITELWADAALNLGDQDLKIMNRLVAAQGRLAKAA